MAEFKPTPSQSAAIASRGSNILVSAGAGSGKTKVLTERLMAYVTDPVKPADLDSFLIITFTRAAAGELRGRIMEELARRLAIDPGNRHLRRQSALCSRAQIGTIHSFCSSFLRENCHLIGITPDFKIMDDERAASMKSTALEKVLEQHYAESEKYPGFTELADTAGQGRDDAALGELVLSLHGKMQCHARPEKWAREQTELLEKEYSDAGETPWGKEILNTVCDSCSYWANAMDALIEEAVTEDKIAKAYLPSISTTADGLREYLRCARLGWDKLSKCPVPEFPRLGTLRNSPNVQLSDKIKERREACKKAMGSVYELIYAPNEKLLDELHDTALPMRALLELTMDFDRAYISDKRRAGFLDYSDLEHLTAKLLTNEDSTPTELALAVADRYTEIMVDEYQDVSAVQDAVFSAISKNNTNLFLVGDVKQSIYRFRLADPGIFTEKYLSYKNADAAKNAEPRRIMLQENFRSRREILNCANAVFSACMSERLGDIDYDEDAALKYGAGYEGEVPVPEIMLLDIRKDDDEEETPDKSALEAQMVGRKIAELMSSGMKVGGRALEYGDIAILMRSANNMGGIYARELSLMGIPTDAGFHGDFFTSVEVSMLISLLSVIDNPHKDVPLIAVLRSPIFAFTADELSDIRSCSRDGDFYSCLVKCAETDEKSAAFLKTLEDMRVISPDMSANELLWHIINTLDLIPLCSAMSGGRERRENLMELCRLSERFDETGFRGLHRFVLWLNRLAKKGKSDGGSTAGGSVKIMTVHKSKGLEFPIVFLSDTARQFNMNDNSDRVLVHSKLGLGPKVYDRGKSIQYPTLARNAIKLRTKRETLSEELRLLYVALTRPRERLFITAVSNKAEKLMEKYSLMTAPIPPQLLESMSAPISWLLSAAIADGQQHLSLSIHTPEENEKSVQEIRENICADEETKKLLERNLGFVYPHAEAQELPSKITATELKGGEEQDEDSQNLIPAPKRSFQLPDFAKKDKPLSGAERGIATHLALQFMNFTQADTSEHIKAEVERLCEQKFITAREKDAVDIKAIDKLFRSDIGKRMLKADMLKREFKFSLLCDANEIFAKAQGEELLLQGVVDCCIAEDGKLTIIDYKTDNVRTQEEIAQRTAFYTGQLRSYASALERIFNMEVRQCVLFYLTAGKSVSVKI